MIGLHGGGLRRGGLACSGLRNTNIHSTCRSGLNTHQLRRLATKRTHYQTLDLAPGASPKEIKLQFKRLSKKHHPDVNAHLDAEAREANNTKYVEMVLAYDVLKHPKKKRDYDASLAGAGAARNGSGASPQATLSYRRSPEFEKYYGEARYHSRTKASGSYTSRGYNYTRHRVHNAYSGELPRDGTRFSGMHTNRLDRFDVPHFDYNHHLLKHLKFEQRILERHLTPEQRDAVLRQLAPDGDFSKINEEVLTKHLMRQASTAPAGLRHSYTYEKNPYMYQSPGDAGDGVSGLGMTVFLAAGAGSMYLLYSFL